MALPAQNPHLPINSKDLTDDCYRLNRRFSWIEQKVFGTVTAEPVIPTPVNIDNLNLGPGTTTPSLPPSPAIAYGPHALRISDYAPQFHVGEFFVETDRHVLYQSQLVGTDAEWVPIP